jgi:hypothetical protein
MALARLCIAPVLKCVNTCWSWLEPRKYPVRAARNRMMLCTGHLNLAQGTYTRMPDGSSVQIDDDEDEEDYEIVAPIPFAPAIQPIRIHRTPPCSV